MKSFNPKKSNRRKFFSTASKSGLGVLFLSSVPWNIFSGKSEFKKLKSVHPHPQAVKRDK